MNIKDFVKYLNETDKGGLWNGDYHTIDNQDIADFISNYNIEGDFDDVDAFIEQEQDNILENADSNTPIYYNDRAEWFSENWSAVDDYINNIGTPEKFDIMETIGCAYCWSYENDFTDALRNKWEEAE